MLSLMSLPPCSVPIGPAAPGHVRLVLHELILAAPGLGDGLPQLVLAGLEVGAEGGDLGLQRLSPPLEVAPLPLDLLVPRQGVGPLPGLLGEPGRAGQHPSGPM